MPFLDFLIPGVASQALNTWCKCDRKADKDYHADLFDQQRRNDGYQDALEKLTARRCLDILGFLRPHSGNSIRLRATMRNSRAETHESICCHLRWRCHCNISLLNASSQDLYTIWQYDGIARRMCFSLFLHVFPLAAFE